MSAGAFWAAVFFGSFAVFAALSALIAVKGVGEIRALFDHLRRGPDDERPRGPDEDSR